MTTTLDAAINGCAYVKREDYHFDWAEVYEADTVAHLLFIRTHGTTVLVPSRAFATHVDFFQFSQEIQSHLGDNSIWKPATAAPDSQRTESIQLKGPAQI